MENTLKKSYIILLAFSFLVPPLGSADVAITHWMFFTLAAIIGISTTIYFDIFNENLKKINSISLPLYSFLCFFLIAILSSFFAINFTESLITILKILTILIHIYLIYTLRVYDVFPLKVFLGIISLMLFLETTASLYPVFNEILSVREYQFNFTGFLKGFTGNKNITAASICIKIPFVLMFINKSKNIYLRLILFLIATIAVLNLFFLSSRATFLSLIIIFVFYFFQKIFFELRRLGFFNLVKRFIYIPFIFIISFYVFDNNSKENDRSKIQNRVASISMQDESASQRIRYYTQAIVYASQHPLMGTGIGNWKIKSVDVDKDNIYSYIIPYVMHNDFLEILVETNLLGLLSYLLFFLSIYWILYKGYMKTKDVDLRDSLFLTACALTVYFIDANLNFPLYRPIMQINLLLILIISLYLNLNIYKNENQKKL